MVKIFDGLKKHNSRAGIILCSAILVVVLFSAVGLASCGSSPASSQSSQPAQGNVPQWVNDHNKAFPQSEWVAVVASGTSQRAAEQAAMNNLARVFRTDVESLTQASQRFSQIINDASGKKSFSMEQSQDFSQEVTTSTNIRGLIGVQTDQFQAGDGTFYVNARMHRQECGARYSRRIQENSAVINQLLSFAQRQAVSFEAYSALSFAAAIADITDNFQNILEVLDATAVNRKPNYGGANAIKTRMRELATRITIGIIVDTPDQNDATLIRRALASRFTDLGFSSNEQGRGNYILRSNVRFEALPFSDRLQSSRYYFNAALEDSNSRAIFSFTEDDRRNHQLPAEAKRLAVRAVETSVKEEKFAKDLNTWLNSLVE